MEALVIVAVFAGTILVLRLLGAWMLRISDVVNLQKDILQELKKLNDKS